LRPTAVMSKKRLEKERNRFQIAGTVFWAFVMVVVLIIGFAVNAESLDKGTVVKEQQFYIQVTPEQTTENTGRAETSFIPTATVVETKTDKPMPLYYDIPLSEELQDYIFSITAEYGVPCDVVISIINRETNYRANATGAAGERGYMQIHPINFEWLTDELGITDFYDPEQNILCGVYMLSRLYDKYDTTTEVLMCYNCGEAGAKRLWAQGVTSTEYSRAITDYAETLEFTGGNFQ